MGQVAAFADYCLALSQVVARPLEIFGRINGDTDRVNRNHVDRDTELDKAKNFNILDFFKRCFL